jgi:hypothetical protein
VQDPAGNQEQLAPGSGAGPTFLAAFTTIVYQQDYVVSGATAEVLGVGIAPLNSATYITPGGTSDNGPHLFSAGQTVIIRNCTVAAYNGSFSIATVPNNTSFHGDTWLQRECQFGRSRHHGCQLA